MKKNISLKYRILIPIIFVLAATVLLMAEYSTNIVENVFIEQTKQQALVWLYGIEREIIQKNAGTDKATLNEIIRYVPDVGHQLNYSISRIYIYDIKGKLLADTDDSAPIWKDISDYHRSVISDGVVYLGDEVEKSWNAEKKQYSYKLDIIIPVRIDAQNVVGLEAELNLEDTIKAIQRLDDQYEDRMVWMLVSGFTVVTLIILLVTQYSVIRPINRIMGVTENIATGAFEARVESIQIPEFLRLGGSINHMAASIEGLLQEQEESYLQMMQSLAKALEAKDRYTASHSGRVANFSVKLGKRIGLDDEQLMLLKKGALLHDLGKIGIPDAILNKPEPLDEHEFELMKVHPVNTATIMRPLKRFIAFTEIAAWHHERWDGSGYPDGLKGEQIPLLARIVAIADSWDAMTGDRVYRKGMGVERALEVLRTEQYSGQWDPVLLQQFIEMVDAEQHARSEVAQDMFDS